MLQGYPKRMRHERGLYRIYTVCFFIFNIHVPNPSNYKLITFFAKILKWHKRLYLGLKTEFNLRIVICDEFQVVFIISSFVGNPIHQCSIRTLYINVALEPYTSMQHQNRIHQCSIRTVFINVALELFQTPIPPATSIEAPVIYFDLKQIN